MCGRPWSPLCWDVSGVVLVWPLFFFILSFLFFLFWTCTSVLLLFVTLVCLSVNFELLLRLLFLQCRVSPQMLKTQALTSPFSPPVSLPHTHTHNNKHNHAPKPHLTPHDSLSLLCRRCAASVADWLSCFLAVTESQWASKERWQ